MLYKAKWRVYSKVVGFHPEANVVIRKYYPQERRYIFFWCYFYKSIGIIDSKELSFDTMEEAEYFINTVQLNRQGLYERDSELKDEYKYIG